MCPFCYLGKRKFEIALEQFKHRHNVQLEWKSFQLNPDLKTDPSISIHDYLAQAKGISVEHARQMNDYVVEAGSQVGLEYNMDKIVVANTLKAHYLLHFASEQGKQNDMKERLLKAYFTEGKNMDDIPTLIALAKEAELDVTGLEDALASGKYAKKVHADIVEAQQIGVRGVPFFVFDRKYAVSGAQAPQVFLQTLERSYSEWVKANPQLEVVEGESCSTNGNCD